MNQQIPEKQTALQLAGPDKLTLNANKPVVLPGDYQILCKVEAVGLCFSDLKLLKQFDNHTRKSGIVSGVDLAILKDIPSYVPGLAPTVPGHETVVRICAMGNKVKGLVAGGRYLVQADYRWVKTAGSNAAFGYNFEGALQEYVLMDQRIINNPAGESALIPASDNYSAAAIALAEPWACVEEAYAVRERTTLKLDGQMLIVADSAVQEKEFISFLGNFGRPARITCISKSELPAGINAGMAKADNISSLPEKNYDDIIYFGSDRGTVEELFGKLASNGLLNIVLCGGRFSGDISSQVGRIHYGNIRIIGTTGTDPSDSMRCIPVSGEIRKGDKVNIVGAAGPMGVMHVIRDISLGIEGISVFAGDLDNNRLSALSEIASAIAEKNNVSYRSYNPGKDKLTDVFDYIVVLVPAPKLVADSVRTANTKAIINIFAGIPANVNAEIDFNAYIEKHLYFVSTSGSTLEDMKIVLKKIESGKLDTNVSVAAVCGINHAADGFQAVEKHLIPGKIIVYPGCRDMPLTALDKLSGQLPRVAECLENGLWNKKAEQSLLGLSG
jgi:L-sorbose 1-phosphate reductase